MKLYEVSNKSYIHFEGVDLFFDHIDGMYSFCLTRDNVPVHLSAYSNVNVLDYNPFEEEQLQR